MPDALQDFEPIAATPDPWAPVHRAPMPADKGKPAAAAKPAAQQKIPVTLELAVPADALKSLASLSDTQAALAGELAKISKAVEAARGESAALMKALAAQGKLLDVLAKASERHAAVIDKAVANLQGTAQAIEAAALTPRRVALIRDKDGMATEAVSRPLTERH